ncbi:MAG: HD domain-containing protein [Clostridia bacterium]|nr:HD domain-containing protein [Clostridia bacterium]
MDTGHLLHYLNDLLEYGPDLLEHSLGVASYALFIAEIIGVDGQHLPCLVTGALLHDLGKTKVERRIIYKPGPLNDVEWAKVRMHPLVGAAILSSRGMARVVRPPLPGGSTPVPTPLDIVLLHHEHWQGTGYYGYQGEDIPLGARIVALADALDAMTAFRPYRKPLSPDQVVTEVRKGSGRQFDPDLAKPMVKALQRGAQLPPTPRTANGLIELLYRSLLTRGGGMGSMALDRRNRERLLALVLALDALSSGEKAMRS